jgi:outer membrane protein TolC
MYRAVGFCLLLLFVPVGRAQDSPAQQDDVLTLEHAIALAETGNRQIKIASKEVDKANEAILASRTQRLPQFHLSFLGGELLTPLNFEFDKGVFGSINGNPVPSTDTEITTPRRPFAFVNGQVTQPLSQLHQINLSIHEKEVEAKLAAEGVRLQRHQIINAVKSEYYTLLQTQSEIEAAESTTATYRELDRVTDQYVAERTVLKYESLDVKAQLAKAELDLVTLQDTLASEKERLNGLMGRDVRTEFSVSGIPEAAEEERDIAAAREHALASRPEIRQASLKIDQAIYDERAQKSQYIPEVSAAFNYLSLFNSQVLPRNSASVGVLVNWDVFDWGYKRHLLEEKKRTTEQSHLNLNEAQSQIVIEVGTRFRKLKEARARLKVAQLSQEAEKEKLRVVMEQHKQKTVLLDKVLEEQGAWAQASTNWQQALAGFWTARAEFEKSLGED